MPPWRRSLRSAASSVIVNLSLSFVAFSMAVITSDSDLYVLAYLDSSALVKVACNSFAVVMLFSLYFSQMSVNRFNPCGYRKLRSGRVRNGALLGFFCTPIVISKLTHCVDSGRGGGGETPGRASRGAGMLARREDDRQLY